MAAKFTVGEQLSNPNGPLSKSMSPKAIELANINVSKVKDCASSTRLNHLLLKVPLNHRF